MTSVRVSDDWYGPGTSEMRQIAIRASNLSPFSVAPDDASCGIAAFLVCQHLQRLQSFDFREQRPSAPDVSVLRGRWRVLHQGRFGTDPYEPWGNRWQGAAQSLGRAVERLRTAVDSNTEARKLVRPPLWPIPPQTNICGGPFTFGLKWRSLMEEHIRDDRDRCVATSLLSTVESCVWDALLWELAAASGTVGGANPFEPLIQLYELGFFPMGWGDNCYDLYVPELSRAELQGLAGQWNHESDESLLSWK